MKLSHLNMSNQRCIENSLDYPPLFSLENMKEPFRRFVSQLHDYDMCIKKNEEALRIDPDFAECYGNMANAWKVKDTFDDQD